MYNSTAKLFLAYVSKQSSRVFSFFEAKNTFPRGNYPAQKPYKQTHFKKEQMLRSLEENKKIIKL